MEIGTNELLEVTGAGGIIAVLTYLYKAFSPSVKTWWKHKTEIDKLKIKHASTPTEGILELLKTQIDELKIELKFEKERAKLNEDKLQHRILELEVTLATLRERYAEKALHSRGDKKIKKTDV